MKKIFKSLVALSLGGILLTSCGAQQGLYLESFAPEEGSLNLVKITDENNNSVVAGGISSFNAMWNYANTQWGICGDIRLTWGTSRLLSLSPDGKKLAYCTRMNKQDNVMVRSTGSQGLATQRTFRNVGSFSWGNDNNIYFSDVNGDNSYICSVNADAGSMMKQHTSGSVWDRDPVVSNDGKLVFFTRSGSGNHAASIWSLNRENGTLTSCARGYNPCLIPGNNEAFYCVRNSTSGRSEIWYVNYVKGEESLILSDSKRSFTNPSLSPDGRWIVCEGNSVSSISKKDNLDIFVVRTDGTNLTQLTYHPQSDVSPVFSHDGRSIYFISSRANKEQSYNIWRMNFNMDM